MKKLLFTLFIIFSNTVFSAELSVKGATISSLKVYETDDDSVNVWIHVNDSARIGPNPDNLSVTCELWTKSKSVHSSALAAMMGEKKVNIWYIDRGDKSHWCKVKMLEVTK